MTAGLKTAIRQSIYTRWAKEQRNSFMIAACISIFLTILSYPGIIYSDSYGRIGFTDSLKLSIHAFFSGDAALHSVRSWLTVLPSFFILLSKEIVGSIALYTFFQCFALFFSAFVFADLLNNHRYQVWNKACILLSPVLWAFGVYYEAGVGCAVSIFAILMLIWKWKMLSNRFDKIITIAILTLSSFLCFGYRANAFSILPAVLMIIWFREKKMAVRAALMASVIIGFLGSAAVPRLLNVNTMSSYAAGFAWETVSVIQSMDADQKESYMHYLDDIFGEGATAAAVCSSSYQEQGSSINPLFYSPINSEAISLPGNSLKLIKKYFRLAFMEPKAFFRMKWEFISHSLGIGKPINMFEYDYNRWDRMNEFGFNDSHPRKVYVNYYLAFMEFMVVFRRPWMLYVLCLLLILVWRMQYKGWKSPMNLYEAAYGVSVFYYGAYLLNTQSFEFRYFFPSWILLFTNIICLSAQIIFQNKRAAEVSLALFLIFVFVSFGGGYTEYTKSGDEMLSVIHENGELLYQENGCQVFYYEDKLYFVSKRSRDHAYTYFLHYYPAAGETVNYDFQFEDYSIPTSFLKDALAVRDIPKQQLSSVAFGQYYGSTRFWEHSLNISDFLICPQEIKVSSFTDDHWENGYSRSENSFLLEDVGIENYLLIGKNIKLPDGSKINITNIEEVEGYLRVYTDSYKNDPSIRTYEVITE